MIWSCKYYCLDFKNLVWNENINFILYKASYESRAFNFLICGSSGIGKNSCLFSFINQLYSQNFKCRVIEIQGTKNDKKKDSEIISDFLEINFFKKKIRKIIIVKNFEYISSRNQLSFRKHLEKKYKFSNFWIICQSFSRISKSILSRCIQIVLKKQGFIQPSVRLKEILDKENTDITLQILEKIIETGKFNFRIYLNNLLEILFLISKCTLFSITIEKKFIKEFILFFHKEYFSKSKKLTYINKILHDCCFANSNEFDIKNIKRSFYLNDINCIYE